MKTLLYRLLLKYLIVAFRRVCSESLKTVEILSIHKNGYINCDNKYRPISILPALSKILESIRLLDYLEKIIVCHPINRYGFPQDKTTELIY